MEKEGLMYGQELSDETLAALMREVTVEVKQKSLEVKNILKIRLSESIKNAAEKLNNAK